MVGEWEAAETRFPDFTPYFYYSTSWWRRASHQASYDGKPWWTVVISTIESYYQEFNQEQADRYTL